MSIADKLTTIAENEQKVYDAGKKAEYDKFWDNYQMNGDRKIYSCAFGAMTMTTGGSGDAWTDDIFYPKYDITSSSTDNMFCRSKITNIKQRLIDCGVSWIDTSTTLYYTFSYANTSHIPDLSNTAKTNIEHAFRNNSRLVSIDGVRVASNCVYSYAFLNCTALEHVIFYGTIGNTLTLQYSTKLDKESITSIVSILSTTVSGKTLTLSKTAVNNAFETAEGLADGTTSTEWAALIEGKSKWTISLV